LQNTFKILLNSSMGISALRRTFRRFDAAARSPRWTDLLKKMIDWLGAHGAKVIEVDTDGIYFVPLLLWRQACRLQKSKAAARLPLQRLR